MAQRKSARPVVEDAPIDAVPDGVVEPVSEIQPMIQPLYSAEGVLLNPLECVVGADGVVKAK